MWTFKLQSSLCQLLSFQRLLELGSPCVMSFAAELCCIEGCWKSRPGTETQGCEEHSYLVWPCRWVQSLDENGMWAPENCPKAWKHLPGHGSPGWGSAPVTRRPFPGCRQRELLPLIGRQSLALLLDFRFRQPLSALWLWILFPPKNPISHLPRGKKNLAKQ